MGLGMHFAIALDVQGTPANCVVMPQYACVNDAKCTRRCILTISRKTQIYPDLGSLQAATPH